MRERYETLAIHDLREIAKIRGIKGASSMSKAKVIDMPSVCSKNRQIQNLDGTTEGMLYLSGRLKMF